MRSKALGIASAILGAIPAVVIAGSWSPAQAILNFDIYQDGNNVVVKASGTLSGLPSPSGGGPGTCTARIRSDVAVLCTGPNASYNIYDINSNGTDFIGSGSSTIFADSFAGISAYLSGEDLQIGIDQSYVIGSGNQISSTATFNNKTLNDLGLSSTVGTLATWTIVNSSESVNVNIVNAPTASVPGPLPVLGAGAAFAWSRRLRRRIGLKAAAAVSQS